VAVSDMDAMTQQNASLVEETASASEEMANQAQDLLLMMERFTIGEKREAGSPALRRRAPGEAHRKASPARKEYGAGNEGAPARKNGAAAHGGFIEVRDLGKVGNGKPSAEGGNGNPREIRAIMTEEGFEEF
jgi:hypothetical protein